MSEQAADSIAASSAESASEGAGERTADLRRIEATLDEVERALSRLDDGTYTTCRSCGRPIADDRLTADPTTPFCGHCATGA